MTFAQSAHPVVVTGGSSGIGARVVRQLLDGGQHVIVVDRASPPDDVRHVECDLAECVSIVDAVEALPARIAGLANVAGVSGATGALKAFEVNFLGLRAITEALHPRIVPRGAVVNVASTAGANWRQRVDVLREVVALEWPAALDWFSRRDFDGTTTYDLTKELVVYYGQVIANRRFREEGVRVNTVSPGAVDTPLLSEFETTMGSAALSRQRAVPGRNADPDEIAQAVLFLLSERSSWINGADLHVDGGVEAAFNTGELGQSRTLAHQFD